MIPSSVSALGTSPSTSASGVALRVALGCHVGSPVPKVVGKHFTIHRFGGTIETSDNLSTKLGKIHLDYNQISGSIPSEIRNLINLERIPLVSNHFTGNVPFETGMLQKLRDLDFSENELSGNIPSSLGNLSCPLEVGLLKNLGYLNVSENKLSGEIPSTVGSCVRLETLHVEGCSTNRRRICECKCSSVMRNSKLCGCVPELQQSLCKSKGSRIGDCHFKTENLIGVVGLGSVHKGIIQHDGTIVAIKVLNLQQCGVFKSFMAECEALRNIKHRNFVKMREKMKFTNEPKNLNLLHRLNIAIDVACDFGLARFLGKATPTIYANQVSSIGVRVFIRYTAPEYAMGSEVSAKEDIYSYGILLLEMFTGKRPTDDMFQDGLNLHNYVKMAFTYRVGEVADPLLLRGGEEKSGALP
ncbi:leucine-rich repeat protein kinase family protein [Actinidia rufa]|uniref:Leucine-rich repeat protein kinase family protein n=1 Tax=Actinidia rufa TaxID=165716 RepID=A0A7J0FL38_9ERIC|nr:leucine-rich repeat protein kinase family protein [Actinidia rufa]